MMCIGIFGASGNVGRAACTYLAKYKKDVEILAITGKHDIDLGENIKVVKSGRLTPEIADRYCGMCDVVINCIDSDHSYMIAEAAARNDCAFIDTSGTDLLRSKLDNLKGCFVLNCGFFPGVTGVMMRYMIEKYTEEPCWSGYVGNSGALGYGAAKDMLLYMKNGFGKSSTYFCNGIYKKINTPAADDEGDYRMFFPDELKKVAGEHSDKTIRWYIKRQSKAAENILMRAGLNEKIDESLIRKLIEISGEEEEREDHIDIFAGERIETEGTGISLKVENAYSVTGMAAALTASFLVQSDKKIRGIYNMCDLVEPSIVIDSLKNAGISLEEREVSVEEGVI